MRTSRVIVLALTVAAACADLPRRAPRTALDASPRAGLGALPSRLLAESTLPHGDEATEPAPERLPRSAKAMSDAALGALIRRLSEETGDFPSDNFVSNETSLLHPRDALTRDLGPGRAYVGVGPEQNLTYIAILQPRMSYIVDIRRGNLIEHLVLRAAIEPSKTREAFLRRLTSRPLADDAERRPADAPIDELTAALAEAAPSRDAAAELQRDAEALLRRLDLDAEPSDHDDIARIVGAFAARGVEISYSMERSRRRYPTLRELAAATDLQGRQASFLANEARYAAARDLLLTNRVVPVVGDFLGDRALRAVAADMRNRALTLGVFYTSNVEEYLFPARRYERFLANVRAFPLDRESRFVRVWFDRGRPHPDQVAGHRTTTVVHPILPFLERAEARPFRTFWQVVTYHRR